MMNSSIKILAFGAHPDDCDISAGGTALLWAKAGCKVKFVSVTNGEGGHHEMSGEELVARRTAESQAAAKIAGIEYLVMDNPDGQLVPGLEQRWKMMRVIREFKPDLILTHRPNDYHPDHRYTSQLVQDCAYLVGVPNVCPDVPPLRSEPVIAYFQDNFQKPHPFHPDVTIDIDPVYEEKIQMLHCHQSQFYEWLPWIGRHDIPVSNDPEERLKNLRRFARPFSEPKEEAQELLRQRYGEKHGSGVQHAECFEGCEYGAPLNQEAIRRLFPLPE
ncbi:MAG: PIG-L family deacetylase [Verrucomicrobiales bacterium]|nr:PIG-L family deacetylase [Verrucomicrobiales bacterium]